MNFSEFFKSAEAAVLSAPMAEFSADAASPLRFRKELIYAGRHVKKRPGQKDPEYVLDVDRALIDHWVETHKAMLDEGVEVPAPLKHTTDPQANRGKWVGLEAGKNKDGKDALYGVIEFADAEAAKLAKTANVSIYVVNEYTSGKGTTYKAPIRHIALTDYPIVPGLSKFEALAADDEGMTNDDKTPDINALLGEVFTELGITSTNDITKDVPAIVEGVKALKVKSAALSDEDDEEPALLKANAKLFGKQTQIAFSDVDELIGTGVVTTHIGTKLKDDLKKMLKAPTEGVGLSSDDSETNEQILACFSAVIDTLKTSGRKMVRFGEKTGPQLLDGDTKTVLVSNAEKRRKK